MWGQERSEMNSFEVDLLTYARLGFELPWQPETKRDRCVSRVRCYRVNE